MKAPAPPGASAKSYSLPFRRLVLRRTSRTARMMAVSALRIAITGPMLSRTHSGAVDYSRNSFARSSKATRAVESLRGSRLY